MTATKAFLRGERLPLDARTQINGTKGLEEDVGHLGCLANNRRLTEGCGDLLKNYDLDPRTAEGEQLLGVRFNE